jgi:hypothetical protein
MRTKWDAYRSVRRYVASALEETRGEQWEVLFGDDRGDLSFPFAIVEMVEATPISGPATYADVTQPMQVTLYPEPQESVELGMKAALDVEESLFQAFRVGHGEGAASRVPLYDYNGVSLDEESFARGEHDYLRVEDFTTRLLPDVPDPRRIAVVAGFRVLWRRRGRVPSGSQRVADVRLEQVPE